MKYRVISRYLDDQEIVEEVVFDTWELASEYAITAQAYFDDPEQWDDKDVVVKVCEYDEKGDSL